MDLITEMHDFCKDMYPVVEYAYCTIPTYPSGQIGFMLCSTNPVSNILIYLIIQRIAYLSVHTEATFSV